MRLSFLLNWYLNPYHTPIIVAKQMGFYEKLGINLSIIEPNDPSDVAKIIGEGEINLGLKAMVHCYAARERGYKIKSIGTLLDEPPTGLISIKNNKVESAQDLKGKRIGYVGEFGKVMIDKIAKDAGILPSEYTTIKVGMNSTKAIMSGEVDAAMGISCFQQLELEEHGLESNLLRIDKLENLGCCCFCSIMFIANEYLIDKNPDILKSFMKATLHGVLATREAPKEALNIILKANRNLSNSLCEKIFHHTLPFFSKELLNIARDWEKVGNYAKNLEILSSNINQSDLYTNQFITS